VYEPSGAILGPTGGAPSIGELELPVGINHFFLAFRPVEAPSAMEVEFKNTDERCLVDRSLQFFSPGRRHTAKWRGTERWSRIYFRPDLLQGGGGVRARHPGTAGATGLAESGARGSARSAMSALDA
jgi:hypothetical protein